MLHWAKFKSRDTIQSKFPFDDGLQFNDDWLRNIHKQTSSSIQRLIFNDLLKLNGPMLQIGSISINLAPISSYNIGLETKSSRIS